MAHMCAIEVGGPGFCGAATPVHGSERLGAHGGHSWVGTCGVTLTGGHSRGALVGGHSQVDSRGWALTGGCSRLGAHRGHSWVGTWRGTLTGDTHGWVLAGGHSRVDTRGWVLVGGRSWVGTHGQPKALDMGGQTVMQTQVWDDGCRKSSSGPHGVF